MSARLLVLNVERNHWHYKNLDDDMTS